VKRGRSQGEVEGVDVDEWTDVGWGVLDYVTGVLVGAGMQKTHHLHI
jgi:hypothetical protein